MLTINNLSFKYGKQQLYQNFDLNLTQNGVYGLFGRNGSGKSTLLKLLSGLLFSQVGTINVLGFTPANRHPDFLASVYLVPEEFHLPNISLQKMQQTQAAFYPNFSATDFNAYINTFEIPPNKTFDSMSLGEKKKAVIAFALACHTPILLMDEPTNGLDILGRAQFKTIMAQASHQHRIVIISTHQAHDLESLMNHVLFVDGGKLALSCDIATLQTKLDMGSCDDVTQIANTPHLIYQEPLGNQTLYVARNTSGKPKAVNLELMYKALSLQKAGLLAALSNQEVVDNQPHNHTGERK